MISAISIVQTSELNFYLALVLLFILLFTKENKNDLSEI